MRVILNQKHYDGQQSYPPDTIIDWPDSRPLPLECEVRPASIEDAPAVYHALERQHAARVARQEKACNEKGVRPEVMETRRAALDRFRNELANVVDKSRMATAPKRLEPVGDPPGGAPQNGAPQDQTVVDPLT